ncbi:hypothetical protein JCM10914A_40690 [Paenibacillus sp. JCM 10914]|uniref:hypothetical protein n=1 Tax=Paenibacillus sp. JCM 10914 TaxID=1236974 RepID=UPI0003CC93C2|nr:hypothetical protein [Paenibacillus sp. JCM 10914]GAE05281.1 hypothetical protein JCM10914_1377 [Paenibacillus sp. JCM 10914]
MLNLGKYGSRDILKLQIFDYATKKPIMTFDYANTASQEMTSSRVYAMGAGARRIAWDGEKTAKLTMETQLFSMQHLAMLAGEEIRKGKQNIYKTEVITVQDDGTGTKQVTLSKPPVGSVNEVSVHPYINGISTEVSQTVTSVTGNVVELDASATVAVGDEVEVYYQFEAAEANTLSFTATGFPKYVYMVGDTSYTDEVTGEVVGAQIVYHKAKIDPNFTISMSATGDPSSLSLVFDLFPKKIEDVDTIIDMVIYED